MEADKPNPITHHSVNAHWAPGLKSSFNVLLHFCHEEELTVWWFKAYLLAVAR